MLRVNEFQFYELAIAVHPLTQAMADAKYSEVWLDWSNAASRLNSIFNERSLEFCLGSANDLYAAIGNVVPHEFPDAIKKYQDLVKTPPEPELGWGLVHPIAQAAIRFETILAAELSNSDTYWVSPKATHKTSMLLRSARSILPESILQRVPEAADDFDEAGRCWLFDNYTAVGFHLMRATDAVMRRYYRTTVGVEPKLKFRNWGAYVKNLRNCPRADQKIVNFLDQIRDNYRNPILHPEQNLTADDAQILFGVCVSVISMMALAIQEITKKGELLPLTENPALPDNV
jgi:hypothetical protein